MDQLKLRQNPEQKIQNDIIKLLEKRGWVVMPTHGNLYQRGFPDLYAFCGIHGQRWIEVKNPKQYSFTESQRRYFPLMEQSKIGIWILTAATETEYNKLFQPANWRYYYMRL